MKRILILLMVLILFSSCSNNIMPEDKEGYSDFVDSSETENSNIIVQESKAAELPTIGEPNLECYSETYDFDEMLEDINIKKYTDDWDNRDVLENIPWYRDYQNRDTIIVAATEIKSEISVEGAYSSFFPAINNSISLNDVLTESTIEQIVYATDSAIMEKYSLNDNPEVWELSAYPIVFLRQITPGVYYTVYKITGGGWLYNFYAPWPHETEVEGVYEYCDDMSHITYTGGVYVENVLEYADFSSIEIGSSITDVEAIDSAVSVYRFVHELNAYPGPGICHEYYKKRMESRHLLTDGLLKIVYEKSGNSWSVCEMEYSEDFLYTSSFYPWYWEQIDYIPNAIFHKQFKILPQDYPPAS